jgi:tetratricopeptide (TPR) repeat protein
MKQFMIALLLLLPGFLRGQGMWLPLYLEKQNEKDMQSLGLRLDADDIYAPAEASLKDAICQFSGGCTGEMISAEGLLLTNHHCGFDAIQGHSTLEHNYVDDGFWAKTRAEEKPTPGATAMFVTRMEDVTALALRNVVDGMGERDRQAQIEKNFADIRSITKKEKWEDLVIRPFYNGNQYFLFVTQTFRDVRLVGAPPSSIGKFGADTDNWVWPRHTGDFSLFRVYANKDNQPADYSPDNVPFRPRHFLPISLDGVGEGDFTMVFGFPGRTDEYLPAVAVQQTMAVIDPARVGLRARALKIMDESMRRDPAVKIAYVARYASIANAWKKWLGEMQGLEKVGAVAKKREYEAEFLRRVKNNADWNYRYGNLLPRLEQAYQEAEPYFLTRELYNEALVRNNELLATTAGLAGWIKTYDENGEAAFARKLKEIEQSLDEFYKDYRPEVDEAVNAALLEIYANGVRDDWGGGYIKAEAKRVAGGSGNGAIDYAGLARHLFANSVIASRDKMKALLARPAAEIVQTLKSDPAYQFWKAANDVYVGQVQPKAADFQAQINLLQRQYMAAQMAVFKEKRFFPDANSTLRLTYGRVAPYSPRDAVIYDERTYLGGVIEKYVPGDYEFDVPQKLRDLWKNKDFGRYADETGDVPVAFIGTNHTTGGNSGSPALDANGNLVGLNFDRVWEGTMSDINYDPALCRNIMVDMRYVLFIIDKFAGATNLIDEMKIVKGQRKKKK